MFRSDEQRKAVFARMNRAGNKAISTGYRVHAAGKTIRRVGMGVAGAGLGVLAARDIGGYIATGGGITGKFNSTTYRAVRPLQKLYSLSPISRIPAVNLATQHFGTPLAQAAQSFAKQTAFNLSKYPKVVKTAGTIGRAMNKLAPDSFKAIKYGLPVAAAGAAVSYVGGRMLSAGYKYRASGKGSIGRKATGKVKYFFTGKHLR